MTGGRERGLAHRAASLFRLRGASADAGSRAAPPEELVDAFFDRELAPDETRSLFQALRAAPAARDEFDRTQDMLDGLRRPVAGPDFTASVLAEVGRRRHRPDQNGLCNTARVGPGHIAGDLAAAGRVADVKGVLQVECTCQRDNVVRIYNL